MNLPDQKRIDRLKKILKNEPSPVIIKRSFIKLWWILGDEVKSLYRGIFYKLPMMQIELSTLINAPIAHCFKLACNIDLHMASTSQTGERAIAGKTGGLIGPGESVTWRAKHFGVWQNLTSKITEFQYPDHFTDEMVSGAFKSFRHEHLFFTVNGQTMMKDIFLFESPGGWFGSLANFLFLGRYMEKLLTQRNKVIKEAAERTA